MSEILKHNIMAKIMVFALIVVAFIFFALPAKAAVSPPQPAPNTNTSTSAAVCDGLSLTGGDCDTSGSSNKLNNIVANIINIFSWVVGALAVIMLVFGGFKYITSGGDSAKVKSAKDTILYALVGVAVVALSQVIVNFVLGAANKATTEPPSPSPAKTTMLIIQTKNSA